MKKVFLWIGIVMLTPVMLFLILTLLLYLPPVQNRAVQRATAIASEQTGMDISVGRVRLVFPLDLGIEDVRIIRQNDSLPQVRDTVADVRRIVVDVRLRPLFCGRVVVDELELDDTHLNTSGLIASARIKGSVERLAVKSRGIDLRRQTVDVDEAVLSNADIDVALSDTVPEDTTKSETRWKIYINKVDIDRTGVTIHMPGDTLRLSAYIGKAAARTGEIDLGRGLYSAASFDWADGRLTYDDTTAPRRKGLDAGHIALSDIAIGLDSVYYCAPAARLSIRQMAMKEKSGIEVSSITGRATMDTTHAELPSLRLRTPDSDLEASATMDLNALDSINPGRLSLRLMASIGKQDVIRFCGDLPQQFVRRYPNRPITVRGSVNGNLRHADITGLRVSLPTAFTLTADGYAENPTDMERLKADVKLKAEGHDLGFVTALAGAGAADSYRLPPGMTLDARLKADGRRYAADMTLHEGHGATAGTVKLDGRLDSRDMNYQAQADISRLNLHHFMPHDSLYTLTAQMSLKGRGTDLLARRTRMEAAAHVERFRYGSLALDSINATARVADGQGHVSLVSHNRLMDGTLTVDALLDPKRIAATVATDLRSADLYRLRLMENPMTAGVCAHIDVASDMKQYYMLRGYLNDFTLRTARKTYRPTDLELDVMTRRDTTWARIVSGTMKLDMAASGGYEKLMEQGLRLKDEAFAQLRGKIIDQPKLREMLPRMSLRLTSGTGNPFSNFLRFKGFAFDKLFVDLNTSPEGGLNGDMQIGRAHV